MCICQVHLSSLYAQLCQYAWQLMPLKIVGDLLHDCAETHGDAALDRQCMSGTYLGHHDPAHIDKTADLYKWRCTIP